MPYPFLSCLREMSNPITKEGGYHRKGESKLVLYAYASPISKPMLLSIKQDSRIDI
jgi:hypothetical protein